MRGFPVGGRFLVGRRSRVTDLSFSELGTSFTKAGRLTLARFGPPYAFLCSHGRIKSDARLGALC